MHRGLAATGDGTPADGLPGSAVPAGGERSSGTPGSGTPGGMLADATAADGAPAADGERVTGHVLAALFRTHHLSLVRLAVLLVGDQAGAEDLVQDVYARMQRRHERRGGGGGLPSTQPELLAYARTAVLNAGRTLLRRRALTHRLFQAPRPVWSAENDALVADDRRRVLHALGRLPARQREAIVLRYYLDLSESEIAAAMGVRPGTVKSTISRGLDALRDRYEEER
ncbi:hypothetical protein GCM10009735_59980 [Actinomadura chokoriensis]